jgi:hypothetical protein
MSPGPSLQAETVVGACAVNTAGAVVVGTSSVEVLSAGGVGVAVVELIIADELVGLAQS